MKDSYGRQCTTREAQRVVYTLAFLQGKTKLAAARKAGLQVDRVHRYHKELCQHVKNARTFRDKARSGRPPKYTERMLQVAMVHIIDYGIEAFTGPSLVAELVELGELPVDTNAQAFMRRLKMHVKACGMHLVYSPVGYTYLITRASAEQREEFCRELLPILEDTSQPKPWFLDEILLQFGGHPKCKYSITHSGSGTCAVTAEHKLSGQAANTLWHEHVCELSE